MKIGIDLNDVYRAYTSQFATYYKKEIDRTFDIENVDVWTNDLKQVFPFESSDKYFDFLYNELPAEIFGGGQPMEKGLAMRLNDWVNEIEDLDEVPELCILSTKEYGKSIGGSMMFIGKYATRIREVHMLLSEDDVWNKCDIIITANPNILNNIPENKIAIKIHASYNEEIESEITYESLMEFLNDGEIIEKLYNKLKK